MMNNNLRILLYEVLNEDLKKLVLGNKRKKSLPCRKVVARPVAIKGELRFQFEYHYDNKVTHENLTAAEANSTIMELVESSFKQADIFTTAEDIQVLASKPDNPRIKRKKVQQSDSTNKKDDLNEVAGANIMAHDRKKNYIIPEGVPCDFLVRLGVMDKDGRVFKKHYAKFRQINRYLEIVDDIVSSGDPARQETPMKIIDFGCGKAYLTFALYHYFRDIKGMKPDITGLDLKENVIEFCNRVAEDLGYDTLTFKLGDIADYKDTECHMVVTLHACDTATDYALINAVKWNAPVILSVPCCQHELFKQIKNETMQPMLKHGIIKDKFTELLTDGLRGLALEAMGYDVDMIEFTTLEHTQKNILIRAVKRPGYDGEHGDKKSKRALQEYNALKSEFNVRHTIDGILPSTAASAAEAAAGGESSAAEAAESST